MNKLGFGFLRLPKIDDKYDWESLNTIVDAYISSGRKYFDTCYTYLDGNSEEGIRRCVTQRYPRGEYILADKLPGYLCKSRDDCQKYFDEQLRRCGVERFDVYMLHWLNAENYETAQRYDQFGFLREIKAKGLADRIGFSYHDSASLLDEILTAHPEVDIVLLQINYLDWDSAGIESGKCYEVCVKHGKSICVMEPVKGGTLANVPEEAEKIMREKHPDWSPADWALRFVQSLPGVEICLSGMNSLAQVLANTKEFEPLSQEDKEVLKNVCGIIERDTAIACTGCRYCETNCPLRLPIPDFFKMYNELARFPGDDWKIKPSYHQLSAQRGKASQCLGCHNCERHCPQHIPVTEWMEKAADRLEK